MALLRALRRALPALSSPAAVLPRRAPHPLPPPPAPRRFLDPIGLRSFSAAAATASQAPPMGATLFGGLMDTRFPKRRPGFANRRKRASLRPKGPYYWVKCKPDEPIPVSQPNQGSVRGRKEKKRIKQRKDFIMVNALCILYSRYCRFTVDLLLRYSVLCYAEKKKRRAQYSAAVKRKEAERTERKMAAVARERAWAARLIELKQIEEDVKAVMA
ncbi:hypothetical protein ZEAMMB73_Zm00001d035473 [Zea mays]|uniref:Uncharacterized protein n=1 Tax=Zea mays TaxID=4577 RepID=A0A1D6LGJ2_MAIZE|nr:hypothetical protein ZEAMMB73_Zm00001d035473 [Zea mays]